MEATTASRVPQSPFQSSAAQCRYIFASRRRSCAVKAAGQGQYHTHCFYKSPSHTTCVSRVCLSPHSSGIRRQEQAALICAVWKNKSRPKRMLRATFISFWL